MSADRPSKFRESNTRTCSFARSRAAVHSLAFGNRRGLRMVPSTNLPT